MGLTFNRMIPQSVIDAFRVRIFNLHLSLLPALPGFGATKRALLAGLSHTGVTVHFIDAGIDTGPIVAQQRIAIESTDNEASLGRRQFEAAVPLLLQTVRLIERKSTPVFDQPDSDSSVSLLTIAWKSMASRLRSARCKKANSTKPYDPHSFPSMFESCSPQQ